jgi:predicted RNA-binding Zn-ribbon protein involved in translation (DUF1610 family)
VTDYLEPYRRIVRSIRFVPPIWHHAQPHHTLTEPARLSPPIVSTPLTASPVESPVAPDPSEHVLALIQAAVARPTELPVQYVIPESIGDRISRMTTPAVVLPPPREPQPWLSSLVVPNLERIEDKSEDQAEDDSTTASPGTSAAQLEVTVQPVAEAAEIPAETTAAETVIKETAISPEEGTREALPTAAEISEAPPSEAPSEETPSEEAPATIEAAPAEAADAAVSKWIGSVTDYLETVTHTLEAEISQPIAQPEPMVCPECGSSNIRKNGSRGLKQKYQCKSCRKQFTGTIEDSGTPPQSGRAPGKQPKGFGAQKKRGR